MDRSCATIEVMETKNDKKVIAVLISDIHFSVSTLELASASLRQALVKAHSLGVEVIIAGDLLDSKAIIRAECANRLLEILKPRYYIPKVTIITGNHDLLNEKGPETALSFLAEYCTIISRHNIIVSRDKERLLLPYINEPLRIPQLLEENLKPGGLLICHQGVQTAYMGHYTQDRTSLPKEAFKDYRVISGHYHKAQTIQCGEVKANNVGLFSYIGNPYTLNFGEAQDGPKGFQLLHEDGSLTHVPTNLRKHIIVELTVDQLSDWKFEGEWPDKADLLWLKVSGPATALNALNKKEIAKKIIGHENFKLDKIYEKLEAVEKPQNLSAEQLLDKIVKTDRLRKLWRELLS